MPPSQQKTEPKSQESEVDDALTCVMMTMHTITPSKYDVCLGPILTTEVEFEGSPVKALHGRHWLPQYHRVIGLST